MAIQALIQPPELRSEANFPAINSWLRKAWEINRQLALRVQELEDAVAGLGTALGELSWLTTGTAAPATGDHSVGEYVINSVPTVGQPTFWTCTVAGTPGTWVAGDTL